MKILHALLALVFCCVCDTAVAQKPSPEAPAGQLALLTERAPEAVENARTMVRIIFIDSGVIDTAIEQATSEMLPGLSHSVSTSAFYRSLPQPRRAALDPYIRSLDGLVNEIIYGAMPDVLDHGAAGTLAMYTDEEIAAISALMRDEEVQRVFGELINMGASQALGAAPDSDDDFTEEQRRVFDTFERSAHAARFAETGEQWFTMLGRVFETQLIEASAGIGPRVQRDMCNLLESDCPPSLRRPVETL